MIGGMLVFKRYFACLGHGRLTRGSPVRFFLSSSVALVSSRQRLPNGQLYVRPRSRRAALTFAFSPLRCALPHPSLCGSPISGVAVFSLYLVGTALCYARRSGKRHELTMREVLFRKVLRPRNMPVPNYIAAFLGWLCFLAVYPILELVGLFCRYSTFYYYYPNAHGAGMIFAPVVGQARDVRGQAFRLDWHKFHLAVGPEAPGGGRESVTFNLPHVNSPARGIKTWPWRQHPWLVRLLPWRAMSSFWGAVLRGLRRCRQAMSTFGAERNDSPWQEDNAVVQRVRPPVRRKTQQLAAQPSPNFRSYVLPQVQPLKLESSAFPNVLPMLTLCGERVVLVDSFAGELDFANTCERAAEALQRGNTIRVAMDAEWGRGSHMLSLLQLAIEVDSDGQPCVFVLDMLSKLSSTTRGWCQKLLLKTVVSSGVAARHQVLAFSPRGDLQRLAASGILPEELAGASLRSLGWLDLQRVDWGLGNQPGLQKVVRHCLSSDLDKRMQTSDWDRRPLTQEQLDYAALDALCLIYLHRRVCQSNAAEFNSPD